MKYITFSCFIMKKIVESVGINLIHSERFDRYHNNSTGQTGLASKIFEV